MMEKVKDNLELDKDMRLKASIQNTIEELENETEKKEDDASVLNKFKRKFNSVVRRR